MTVKPRPFPPALPHGDLTEVLPGIHHVTGTVAFSGPLPIRFSRTMTVVKEGERLVLVNTLRLDDAGLAALDRLGRVTDVIRLAGFHGMDDPFYKDRYGAKVHVVRGQRYTAGFDTGAAQTYFTPDVELDAGAPLPLEGGRLVVIDSTPPEGLLVLERHGGVVVTGDALQNWAAPDAYFSWLAKPMMRVMGFLRPYNVGPGWLEQAKPPKEQLRALLDLRYAHVLPCHGAPVIGGADALYRPALERVS